MPSARASRSAPSSPRLVVDIGNTRIKWGLCSAVAVIASASLPPDDPPAWHKQLDAWKLSGPLAWAISSVHPARCDRIADWLRRRGDTVRLLLRPKQLSLEVALPHPSRVGIDRLLDAVAVNSRRSRDAGAVIVDAGSAVTVDYVDRRGVFRGGAIFPGLGLMAKALHDYTALLPIVNVKSDVDIPGTSTPLAIKAGIFSAVVGGINHLIEKLVVEEKSKAPLQVFCGGGDGGLLGPHIVPSATLWPLMTLEGLRITAWSGEKAHG